MKIIIGLAIGLFVAVAIFFTVYLFQVGKVTTLSAPITIEIEDNIGTEGVVNTLIEANLINQRWPFLVHVVLTGKRTDLKAGSYTFEGDINLDDIIETLAQEKISLPEVEITLLEGWTNEDMSEYLSKAGLVDDQLFLSVTDTNHSQDILPDKEYDYLIGKPLSVGLQGFLFPDTYRIFEGETEIGIVEKMLDNFDLKFTEQMRQDLAAQNRSIYDAVILASIVEKEVRSAEDKAIAAGIFWKRLDQGMRIQSDATINYITKKKTTRPSSVDLQVESAYNTYRNDGLPPAPICNPGLDSLAAAVYPTESEYYYFLTKPEGDVVYSKTYEEHLTNKNIYYPQ